MPNVAQFTINLANRGTPISVNVDPTKIDTTITQIKGSDTTWIQINGFNTTTPNPSSGIIYQSVTGKQIVAVSWQTITI